MRGIALLLLATFLPGCASEGPAAEHVKFPDVHGVAIDPLDTASVYVATHVGLFHGDADGWERVGNTTYDLMGFTLAADGRTAFASGHSRTGNLGLVRSTDGGRTWLPIGAAGADFHALTVSPAEPSHIYGYFRGNILHSDDGGARWVEQAEVDVSALAAHPTEPMTIYGATTASIGRSDDAGRTWTQLAVLPAYGIAVDDALYVSGKDFVKKSSDAGATWQDVASDEMKGTFAHVATRGDIVVAASYEGAVWRSDDAGATWREIHAA